MGAWFVLSALGLFSAVPGTPNYVLGAPLFREVVISGRLNGGALRIVAEGTGPAVTAVDAVLLFTHGSSVPTILSDSSVSDGPLQRGGTLRFVMKGEGWQRGATLAAQATHLTSPGGAGAGAGTRPSLAPPVAHAPVVAATHTGWFHQAVTATQEDKQQEKNKLQEKIALSDALDKAAAEADASRKEAASLKQERDQLLHQATEVDRDTTELRAKVLLLEGHLSAARAKISEAPFSSESEGSHQEHHSSARMHAMEKELRFHRGQEEELSHRLATLQQQLRALPHAAAGAAGQEGQEGQGLPFSLVADVWYPRTRCYVRVQCNTTRCALIELCHHPPNRGAR